MPLSEVCRAKLPLDEMSLLPVMTRMPAPTPDLTLWPPSNDIPNV